MEGEKRMKRISLVNLFSLVSTAALCFSVIGIDFAEAKEFKNIRPKVIYGNDDRLDVYQVSSPGVLAVAASTAAMIPVSSLEEKNGGYTVIQKMFGEEYGLCKAEPFYNQPNAAMCSGFLVGPDLLATAGHCVAEFDCSSKAFVFNYKMADAKTAPSQLANEDVYFCKGVVARELTRQQDYALIRLDRPVVGKTPLKISTTAVTPGDELIMVGHPSGLPTKIAGGASVRKIETGFFSANTDSYGGNSGSAVFNAKTLEVVGILVRGEEDFVWDYNKQCTKSNFCKDDACRGEDITMIDYITKNLPQSSSY